MNEKEIAYREGYAKGYQDAKKEERHGRWELHGNDDDCGCSYFCSNCHNAYDEDYFYVHGQYIPYNYCPNCGAIMDLPNITEQTENALRKLGDIVRKSISTIMRRIEDGSDI